MLCTVLYVKIPKQLKSQIPDCVFYTLVSNGCSVKSYPTSRYTPSKLFPIDPLPYLSVTQSRMKGDIYSVCNWSYTTKKKQVTYYSSSERGQDILLQCLAVTHSRLVVRCCLRVMKYVRRNLNKFYIIFFQRQHFQENYLSNFTATHPKIRTEMYTLNVW